MGNRLVASVETDITWMRRYGNRPLMTYYEQGHCPVHRVHWSIELQGDFNCPLCAGELTMQELINKERTYEVSQCRTE